MDTQQKARPSKARLRSRGSRQTADRVVSPTGKVPMDMYLVTGSSLVLYGHHESLTKDPRLSGPPGTHRGLRGQIQGWGQIVV